MKAFTSHVGKIFRTFITGFMAMLTGVNVVTIVLQVLLRYLKKSIAWTNELAGISLVWITFLGATLATIDESHIGFDTLIKKMKPMKKLAVQLLCNIFVALACAVIFYHGIGTAITGINTRLVSLPGTLGTAFSIVPVCAFVMLCAAVSNSVKDIRQYIDTRKKLNKGISSGFDEETALIGSGENQPGSEEERK